ncbi:MAG: diguanylate cyclase [Gammaproteobacteria bacterium]|jgi:diguanylate cyclase
MGRLRTVLLITLVSMVISILVTSILIAILNQNGFLVPFGPSLSIAALVPLIVAPIVSWYLVGLMLKVMALEQEMRNLASYDSLTGLLSRHAFFTNAEKYYWLAHREKVVFSIAIVDLDFFKSINDQYGHPAGDAVLKLFGEIALSVSRQSDFIGRLGGEEFIMLLPRTNSEEAYDFAFRLHEAINKAVLNFEQQAIRYTASIGIAEYQPDTNVNLDRLVANADIALYQAKHDGRNQTVVFKEQFEALEKVAG